MGESKPKTRLNLALDATAASRLERLRDRTSAATITEVVRRALHLYDVLSKHQSEGFQVILRDGEVEKELILLL